MRYEDVAQWEKTFEGGSTNVSDREVYGAPWLAGHLHLIEDFPPPPEPMPTGNLDCHQVVVFTRSTYLRERIVGRALHLEREVHPGEAIIASPHVNREHMETQWTSPSSIVSVMLPRETVAKATRALDRPYADTEFITRFGHRDPFVAGCASALAAELRADAPGGRVYGEQVLNTLAVHLATHYTAEAPAARAYRGGLAPAALRRAEEYGRARLHDPDLSLGGLAAAAGYSEWHFARMFRASTGETPARWLQRLRLERAAALLRGDAPLAERVGASEGDPNAAPAVREVAYACGYTNARAFAKAFRRYYGTAPSAYRDRA